MRQFHTVVLERLKEVGTTLETEPYEVGWASEAMLFVRLAGLDGSDAELTATVQVSVDGINWVDEGTRLGPLADNGDSFARLTHFGGWLRARFEVHKADTPIKLTAHLVLKA